jgi:methyl-accepting chemotaxis protein
MIRTIREGVEKTAESMDVAKDKVIHRVEYPSQAPTALDHIIASIDNPYSGVYQIARTTGNECYD